MLNTGPIRGDFPSLKLGRMVRYGSTIERDLLYFLEYWRSVTWYQEQPWTIEDEMPNGQIRHYTPDYEIHEGLIKIIAECKPEARLDSPHAQQQCQIGQAWSEVNGYRFVTFTDSELRMGHQLNNLKLFWRYARWRNLSLHDFILSHVDHHAGCPIDLLCQQLQLLPQDVVPIVCYSLFHQQLHMDLNQPFSPLTTVWIGGK